MSSPPPIRSKLLRILLIPLISTVALWGFIAYSSVDEVVRVSQTQDRWEIIGSPVLQLIVELQRERQFSAEAVRGTGADQPLAAQRRNTDAKVERLRQVIGSVDLQAGTAGTPAQVRTLVQALDGLGGLRASADGGGLTPPLKVIEAYNELIDVATRQFSDRDALSDVSSYRAVRGMSAYSTGAEYLGREHAVLTSTIVHRKMTPTDRAAFIAAFTSRRIVFANAGRDVGPDMRTYYQELVNSSAYKRLVAVEDALFVWDTDGAPPVDPAEWKSDADTVLGAINRDTRRELVRAAAEAQELKAGAYWRLGIVLILGLIAVIASVVLSYRFGRSMIRELQRLQVSAVELAEERLPRLVERLRQGDDVDPDTEAPDLDAADTAEVDRVVHAFSAVQRTAVEAAVGQATLRKGFGQVFLNLARRNQALLHRQLTLLDAMERRIEEPEILEDLFKVDHLTTRMRRHAENLIILSDSAPGRRWRNPVPIFDVVRSAVLEVEDYTRVTVAPIPQAPLLVAAVVTDVMHLIAELVENATVFSPPNTVIDIRSTAAANGFAVEVEDRGLGLSRTTLEELNARLAEPPEFDLVNSDRLGLFVVARLAARHGIKVVLRPSPYGGITAIVLLPASLLATKDSPAAEAASHHLGRAGHALPGRPLRALMAPEAWPREPSVAEEQIAARAPGASPSSPVPSSPSSSSASSSSASPASPVQSTVVAPGPDEDLDGLPMRVPLANLAPQLRGARSQEQRDVSMRSPDELLELMSSMQRGWQQGRSQVEQGQDMGNRKDDHPDA
ncbi:nitrate- and nitrite sensing domain-containing protein [Actinomadura sp. HBU206391]|uniref:sensor histidine kinase n=1 Tax=Actinomadura sp. HBU206391 TaxID=2731692 RepID=UPI00164F77C8|nr:nitrate- and nitrite sensing domain-containing protein [Actinomadura sp. HBU206391]MBC6457019.1 sensor histidine kinase [Actinomadura sp. HBU206391]